VKGFGDWTSKMALISTGHDWLSKMALLVEVVQQSHLTSPRPLSTESIRNDHNSNQHTSSGNK
jgi:hypothetical protein